MRVRLLLPLLAGLLIAAQAKNPKTELDRLQGTWVARSGEENGEKAGQDRLKRKITFKGDQFILEADSKVEGTVKIDPAQKPKTMDLNALVEGKTQTANLIYKLEGDELTICGADTAGKDRPKEFSANKGSGMQLFTFKRGK